MNKEQKKFLGLEVDRAAVDHMLFIGLAIAGWTGIVYLSALGLGWIDAGNVAKDGLVICAAGGGDLAAVIVGSVSYAAKKLQHK